MESLETSQAKSAPDPRVIELREMLQSVLGDAFVRLYHYGSRVLGGAAPDSDYDVLCVTRRPLTRREMDQVMDRRIDLELDRDIFFDLHFYSEEEIRTPPLSFTPYVRHATTDGIVV